MIKPRSVLILYEERKGGREGRREGGREEGGREGPKKGWRDSSVVSSTLLLFRRPKFSSQHSQLPVTPKDSMLSPGLQ